MSAFSNSYAEARSRFVNAARDAQATLTTVIHPRVGPDGGVLSSDIAWVGPEDAAKVLVVISGTHGVEGFFGSAVQAEWLRRPEFRELPRDIAVLFIHAINPYGFAWERRTNEDNVDVNRNWINFASTLPATPGYDQLASDLCPTDWNLKTQERTGAALGARIAEHGVAVFQQAVSGGQWTHPKGLFYGGDKPSWSRIVLAETLKAKLPRAARVTILDFHTGLGPYGYVDPIVEFQPDSAQFLKTKEWLGAAVTSLVGGGSVSSEVVGSAPIMLCELLFHADVDFVTLECGLRAPEQVLNALRKEAAPIKNLIRDAFSSSDPIWQGMALGQGLAVCRAAIRGLHLDRP